MKIHPKEQEQAIKGISNLKYNIDILTENKVGNSTHVQKNASLFEVYNPLPCGVLAVNWDGDAFYANPKANQIMAQFKEGEKIKLPAELKSLVRQTITLKESILLKKNIYIAKYNGKGTIFDANSSKNYYKCFSCPLPEVGLDMDSASATVLLFLSSRDQEKSYFEMADESDLYVAAGFANKIHNPLSAVKGCMEIISFRDQPQDKVAEKNHARTHRCLDMALGELDAANSHLHDFIMCLQPLPPAINSVDLGNLLVTTLGKLFPLACDKNLKIKIKKNQRGVFLNCDQEQVAKGLYQVLANAIDYSFCGNTIFITIDYTQRTQLADIHIKDFGKGILQEDENKIFDPYFTTSAEKDGLGLSIAKSLIENNNGSLKLINSQAQATEFVLTLPGEVKELLELQGQQLTCLDDF